VGAFIRAALAAQSFTRSAFHFPLELFGLMIGEVQSTAH
jgi:hypothetical protein